jgi:hypothetical protein
MIHSQLENIEQPGVRHASYNFSRGEEILWNKPWIMVCWKKTVNYASIPGKNALKNRPHGHCRHQALRLKYM